MTRCAVYRHLDEAGLLLYVGITNDPDRRLAEHKARAEWRDQIHAVTVIWADSRGAALDIEQHLITTERPVFNSAGAAYRETGDALRDWMGNNGLTQSDVASRLGVTQGSFSKMLSGKKRVSLYAAAFIEDWSGGLVPIRYWLFGVTATNSGGTQ